jgi:hypothetical protein
VEGAIYGVPGGLPLNDQRDAVSVELTEAKASLIYPNYIS